MGRKVDHGVVSQGDQDTWHRVVVYWSFQLVNWTWSIYRWIICEVLIKIVILSSYMLNFLRAIQGFFLWHWLVQPVGVQVLQAAGASLTRPLEVGYPLVPSNMAGKYGITGRQKWKTDLEMDRNEWFFTATCLFLIGFWYSQIYILQRAHHSSL